MWRKRPDHHTIPAHSAQVGQPGSFTAVISRQQAQIRDLTAENGQLRRAEYAALSQCADKDRRIADAEADLAQAFDTINDREEAIRSHTHRDGTHAGLAEVLLDLDRCMHGRHQGDVCADCGGPSRGNFHLPAGSVIGYDRAGRSIVVPDREHKHDPAAWRATTPRTPDE